MHPARTFSEAVAAATVLAPRTEPNSQGRSFYGARRHWFNPSIVHRYTPRILLGFSRFESAAARARHVPDQSQTKQAARPRERIHNDRA